MYKMYSTRYLVDLKEIPEMWWKWMLNWQVRNTTALNCKCRVLNDAGTFCSEVQQNDLSKPGWIWNWAVGRLNGDGTGRWTSRCTSDSVGSDLEDAVLSSLLAKVLHDFGQALLPRRTLFSQPCSEFFLGMPESTLRPCIELGPVWTIKSRWASRRDAVLWHFQGTVWDKWSFGAQRWPKIRNRIWSP